MAVFLSILKNLKHKVEKMHIRVFMDNEESDNIILDSSNEQVEMLDARGFFVLREKKHEGRH